MVNSLAVLVFMYGRKVYTIVFKPHLNTKDYFQSKRVNSAFHDAKKKMDVSRASRSTSTGVTEVSNSGF